jgi:hypothetical protein
MITIKNIIILLVVQTTVFYGGFYFNDVLRSMNPVVIPQCLVGKVSMTDHVVKKKRIRWGNSKVTGDSQAGWGFK